ncbi:MAG: GH92 family glycosyl hydrolase [Prolixibacteraceae bacterium]|jgi:predicted alpha-1,2-mannosidase|nr:GH92 family glycosyl hydrolase [Prolixibacteraceae bacterium]
MKINITKFSSIIILTVLFFGCHPKNNQEETIPKNYCQYVNPLVGTLGEGNTYPGAQIPFGMVQLSPDTEKWDWGAASGYEYSDSTIYGFSMTHLHGTGIPDMGDILFMPTTGDLHIRSGKKDLSTKGYLSKFSHEKEVSEVNYYSVVLDDYQVKAELTATDKAGMMRYTFPKTDSAHIILDLSHVLRHKVIWSNIRVEDEVTITGMHQVRGWAKERYVYFAAKFSRPFDSTRIFSNGKEQKYDSYKTYRFKSSVESAGPDIQFVADYKTDPSEQILVKVGISPISTANALKNMESEISNWEFDEIVKKGKELWNKELAKFEVDGSKEQKETFYTAAYHAFMAPTHYFDYDRSYRGLDQNIHKAENFNNYTVFSLWDTYRATHPLFCLTQAERNSDMITSMIKHYEQSPDHVLPVWSFWNNETWCMIGYHAVPVIVDAYFKGVKGVDWELAYQACVQSATHPEYDAVLEYETKGYVPYDTENESVSKTLEYAYDDYCIARFAKALGKEEDYQRFSKRAMAYKNLFDKNIGWMRPKDSKGKWMPDFDPQFFKHLGAFTEGTTWQYTWTVPHDVQGLIDLYGGNKKFTKQLDAVFSSPEGKDYLGVDDIHGRIGHYWHGNEPSHHISHLYSYAGEPWKTQALTRRIIATQYGNKPGSLCGNDDCGQMSAWYIFNAMGFYPVCPGSDQYIITSPAVPYVKMNMSNGNSLEVVASNYSKENIYIQSIKINGQQWDKCWFNYNDIKEGAKIEFVLGKEANKKFATSEISTPPSFSNSDI